MRVNDIYAFYIMDIEYLNPYSDFSTLEQLLLNITVPNQKNTRFKGLQQNRFLTFGLVKKRIGRQIAPSVVTAKYPEIYAELLRIGKEICPFEFTSIHLNKNVVCPRHKDKLVNQSMSVIVSFGDYEGCTLMVEKNGVPVEYNARHHPLLFDGRNMYHWNTPLIRGDKYSLVYYAI